MHSIHIEPFIDRLRRLVPLLALASFAALLFGAKLFLIRSYGTATPFWDQWGGEANRLYAPFLEGRLEWSQLLAPHNEHRSLASWLLSLGLLSANGVWNPLLQMVVNAGLHIALVCLLVNLLTHAVGPRFLPVALGFCLVLFGLPYAHENTLWGFQSCFYFLLLFGVGAIWLVITAEPFSARWWAGAALSVCGFFSLASGAFIPAALAGAGAVQYLTGARSGGRHVASVLLLGGLFVLGAILTPSIAGHASLKATSLPKLLYAWDGVLGWPIRVTVLGPAVRNAPALLFAALMLRTRPPADDRRWFLLTLVLWMLGQSLAIAYGRAVGFMAPRYKDLFAIDVLTNFACLFVIVKEYAGSRAWPVPAAAAWAAIVLGCLGSNVAKHCGNDLQDRLMKAEQQERNTKNYVLTGDRQHLENKPHLHIPYPEAEYLAAYLDRPSIRAVLPRNIAPPLKGVLDEGDAEAAVRADGFGPKTSRPLAPAWGTYGTAGEASMGMASIAFTAIHRGYAVEIPVAGESRADGIELEIEQDGRRWPLHVSGDSNESWGTATATVRGRPFALHITDQSPEAWIAVGSPVAVGRCDHGIDLLLARWGVFVVVGAVMAVTLVTFVSLAPARPVL